MAIDIMAAFENEPPELDFIWPGFLAGTVGALVSPGATGKSFLTLEAAMGIACSVAGGDLLGFEPQQNGRVVYVAGEDPEVVFIRRIHAIGKHLPLEARQSIAQNLAIEAVMGTRLNIMDDRHLARVIEYCAGARLIVFDTLSRIHQLDENSNGDMSNLISTLEHVADKTGAGVLFLHHVSKGSTSAGQADQQQAARGASALIDNARWSAYVSRMTKQEAETLSDRIDRQPIGEDRRGFFVRFGENKQNHGVDQAPRWFERRDGGVLMPVDLVATSDTRIQGEAKPVRRQSANNVNGGAW